MRTEGARADTETRLEMSPAKVTESRRLLLVFTPTLYDWAEPIKP